jgi:putative membrane protein
MASTLPLFGQSLTPHTLLETAGASLVFGLIGIGLLLAGYFLFDLLTRRIDIQEQLNKGNTAVAIVVGAMLLAIAYVAAHAVS